MLWPFHGLYLITTYLDRLRTVTKILSHHLGIMSKRSFTDRRKETGRKIKQRKGRNNKLAGDRRRGFIT
jgi:hypothetical protein